MPPDKAVAAIFCAGEIFEIDWCSPQIISRQDCGTFPVAVYWQRDWLKVVDSKLDSLE